MSKNNVLVTGGAGYIGGHLVRELIKAGYPVTVLDNLSTGRVENLDPKAEFVKGDLADAKLLADLFSSHKFDGVFHMAASLEVEESVREPRKYFENNILNLIKLLDAVASFGTKKIIFSSSASVYGQTDNHPVSETSPIGPNNPYGSTKLIGEQIIKYYSDSFGINAVAFRYFNATGFDPEAKILPTHQSHLIYNVLMAAKGKKALEIFGSDYNTVDGTAIRDYVHVSDIASPHILAFENMSSGFEIYNIGTGHGYSVKQVVDTASKIIKKEIPVKIGPRRAGDAEVTVADNTKLISKIKYQLKYSSLENIISTSWEKLKDL